MSEKAFDGATVVVTGAARGIGAAIAVAFADAGANVCLNDVVDGDEFDDTVERCRSRGAAARKVIADVSDAEAVDRLVATAVEAFGRLDVAVPNAAFSVREPFHTADLDAFRRTVDVTMWGTFHVVRSAVNQFLRQGGGGAVVAVSSTHAYRPVPNAMAYNMSKAAIEHMCRTAATELVAERIRVNCVRPGWVDTPGERTHHSAEKIAELGGRWSS
ncbi:MAG: SDR family oxidoreductase [Planctomycetota bacterium]